MSTRQIGNSYENAVMEMAEALGYATFAARGSRGPVDVVCFDEHHRKLSFGAGEREWRALRSLVIQVGTTGKAIAATLEALQAAPRPIGARCIVARRHSVKKPGKARSVSWTFHWDEGKSTTLADAI